jgi:hypothetical protein
MQTTASRQPSEKRREVKALKERGLTNELQPLIRRVRRAYGMGRIGQEDFNWLDTTLSEVEARIIAMEELDTGWEVNIDAST